MSAQRAVALFVCFLSWVEVRADDKLSPATIDFVEKRIRPVLAEHCFDCHGPKKQTLKLRLDRRDAMLRGGENGPALIPNDPDNSLLIQAVRHQNDLQMPPMKKKLPDAVIADLVEWVRLGAPWPEVAESASPITASNHWAFRPIANPAPPTVRDRSWPINPIDQFVLAKIEANGLQPAPPADKRVLLRRLYFDLLGLPPTPRQIDEFVNDQSPDAYEKLVDRLLASPRFGERWGRYWLDLARFSDTKGYVFFQDGNFPWAHTYRDYVIRSLNRDLPFDRFVMEQLAADKLVSDADRTPLTALGFLTLGGRFMNNVHDIYDDQIDVVTRGFMGLTVGCARCHDHKFDPISQKDYYALYGVFANSVDPEVPPLFEPPPKTAAYETFRKELETREAKLNDFIRAQYDRVIAESKSRVAEYWLAVRAQGDQPPQDEFMLLADGGDINPTMVKRWRAQLERSRRKHDPVLAPWQVLRSLPDSEFAARAADIIRRWTAQPDASKPFNPVVLFALSAKPPQSAAELAKRYADVLNDVERIWLEARKTNPNLSQLPDSTLEQIRLVFHGPAATPATPMGEVNDLQLFPDRPGQAKLQELRKAVEQWRVTGAGAPPRAHALVDRTTVVEPQVFLRGNPHQPGASVSRRMPELFGPLSQSAFRTGSGRLEMANAIVDSRNPLTARVIVNRIWLNHFGRGLVATPSDFGVRSDPPSHPELLDFLASDLMANGWSLKRLHRQIVLSAAYRQQSEASPAAARVDPENRLLSHFNRRRLDFEATRDSMLAAAGRLDQIIGGPSTKDLFAAAATRRTMYGFVDRLQLPTIYRAFDFPSPDATSPQRDQTTIPQQSLFFLNAAFVADCARGATRRAEFTAAPDDGARIKVLYRLILGRTPSNSELNHVRRFLSQTTPTPWDRVAHSLMVLNEFVFVD